MGTQFFRIIKITGYGIVVLSLLGFRGFAQETASLQTEMTEEETTADLSLADASAWSVSYLGKIISIYLDKQPLDQALRTLADRAGLQLAYSPQFLPEEWKISVTMDETTVYAALRKVLEGTGLGFAVSSKGHLVITRHAREPIQAQPETGSISGTVTDSRSGNPLPGANVFLEGTGLGSSTDPDGRYQIRNVPPGTYTPTSTVLGTRCTPRSRNHADIRPLDPGKTPKYIDTRIGSYGLTFWGRTCTL